MAENLKLEYPVAFGKETFSELEIRRPKAKDIRNLKTENMTAGDFIDLLKNLVTVPDKVIDELDAVDFNRAAQVVSGFFANGLETGSSG